MEKTETDRQMKIIFMMKNVRTIMKHTINHTQLSSPNATAMLDSSSQFNAVQIIQTNKEALTARKLFIEQHQQSK